MIARTGGVETCDDGQCVKRVPAPTAAAGNAKTKVEGVDTKTNGCILYCVPYTTAKRMHRPVSPRSFSLHHHRPPPIYSPNKDDILTDPTQIRRGSTRSLTGARHASAAAPPPRRPSPPRHQHAAGVGAAASPGPHASCASVVCSIPRRRSSQHCHRDWARRRQQRSAPLVSASAARSPPRRGTRTGGVPVRGRKTRAWRRRRRRSRAGRT